MYIRFLFLFVLFYHLVSVPVLGMQYNSTFTKNFPSKYYIIDDVIIKGNQHISAKVIQGIVGIPKNKVMCIPGKYTNNIVQKLWKKNFFEDIKVFCTYLPNDHAVLTVHVKELPKIHDIFLHGSLLKKEQEKILKNVIKKKKGEFISSKDIKAIKQKLSIYLFKRKYYYHTLTVNTKYHKENNTLTLDISIHPKKRIKINSIRVVGNTNILTNKIRKSLKNTKQRCSISLKKFNLKFWQTSQLIPEKWKEDQKNILHLYYSQGYLDAKILKTTIELHKDHKSLNITIYIDEGKQYFFGNIFWEGNSLYTDEQLMQILDIKKGDIYNPDKLYTHLHMNPNGKDIRSLYMDIGYLSFNIHHYMQRIDGKNLVDIFIKMHEGKQFYIRDIHIQGNTLVHENVIRRELQTLPLDRFSRKNIIRSQREILQLNLFHPEKCNVIPIPVHEDKVDLIYKVEEKESDELKGGLSWDGYKKASIQFAVLLNNFSLRNMKKAKYWHPFPMGDAQKLSFNLSTNFTYYHSMGISFQEPWLYDKKYSSLSSSLRYDIFTDPKKNKRKCNTLGLGIQRGKRLQWPDDYCALYYGFAYDYYSYNDYDFFVYEQYTTGRAHNSNFYVTLLRNSTDNPVYPMVGSEVNLQLKMTPPYTLLDNIDNKKWLSYQKFMLDFNHYYNIVDKLVFNTNLHGGFLGNIFSSSIFEGNFEKFYIGGTMGQLHSRNVSSDYISLRGYDEDSINPQGGILYQKLGISLRYPIKKLPLPMYVLFFTEAGNTWNTYIDYNFFQLYTSAGFGMRIQLPIVGYIGLDWGYGFQNVLEKGFKFHFSLGKKIR